MRLVFFLFLLLASCALAIPELGGKEVLLILSEQRQDRDGEWLELTLRGYRHDLGLETEDLPVVRMGLSDKDSKPEFFERLGVTKDQLPLLCLAQWSSEEAKGPEQIIEGFALPSAHREKGLEAPRQLFIDWLKKTGRENLVAIILPPANPVELPDPAELAFEEKRYHDAILLARESKNQKIEKKARQEYEKQAALAFVEERRQLALSVYSSLLELYPENGGYQGKVDELSSKPEDIIVGKWKISSSSGWIDFEAFADGALKGKGALYLVPFPGKMEGHWVITGSKERTFQLHWKNGALHNIRVHENGESFEGTGVSDGNVTGARRQ